ncbi:MAG: tyrosine-type recombinase/integrase [Clostridium sp.]|uniref:tyrosine-type recombinase/integrase n=1 Tax=Clostridium sp. TaxID=1506 RepID=UPI00306B9898
MRNLNTSKSEYLFLSERNDKFTRSGIWKIFKKYSNRINEDITLHSFRYYVLRKLLKEVVDLNTVAAITGHSNPLVTAKIYTTASKEDQDTALDLL